MSDPLTSETTEQNVTPSEQSTATDRRQLRKDVLIATLAVVSVWIGFHELGDPADARGMTTLDWLDLGIVGIFIIEFVTGKHPNKHWKHYLRERWWEIPSMIPITGGMVAGLDGIGLIRGLRLVRVVRIVRLLKVVGVLLRLRRVTQYVGYVTGRAHVGAFLLVSVVSILLGTIAVYFAESKINPKLADAEECLWWALNMFTNVAYVDMQVKSGGGRLIAAILQFMGLVFNAAVFGAVANAIFRRPLTEAEPGSSANKGK